MAATDKQQGCDKAKVEASISGQQSGTKTIRCGLARGRRPGASQWVPAAWVILRLLPRERCTMKMAKRRFCIECDGRGSDQGIDVLVALLCVVGRMGPQFQEMDDGEQGGETGGRGLLSVTHRHKTAEAGRGWPCPPGRGSVFD